MNREVYSGDDVLHLEGVVAAGLPLLLEAATRLGGAETVLPPFERRNERPIHVGAVRAGGAVHHGR